MFPLLTSTRQTESSILSEDPKGPVKACSLLDGIHGRALVKSTSYIISMLVSRQPADTSKAPHHPPYNALYPMKQLPLGYPDGVSFFPRITQRTATAMFDRQLEVSLVLRSPSLFSVKAQPRWRTWLTETLYFLMTREQRLSQCDLTVLHKSHPVNLSCSEECQQIHGRNFKPHFRYGHRLWELIMERLPPCCAWSCWLNFRA